MKRASSGTRRTERIPRESGPGCKPDGRLRTGTTRERSANRPGRRPLARPRVHHHGGEGGWDRGRKPLVLSKDARLCDSQEAMQMSEQQGDSAAGDVAIEVEDPIALEVPERGSADELMDHGAAVWDTGCSSPRRRRRHVPIRARWLGAL